MVVDDRLAMRGIFVEVEGKVEMGDDFKPTIRLAADGGTEATCISGRFTCSALLGSVDDKVCERLSCERGRSLTFPHFHED